MPHHNNETATDALIDRLAADLTPVRPLTHPVRQGLGWAVLALLFGALMVWAMGPRPDLAQRLTDGRFLLEQGATLLTGVTAAIAALAWTRPGSPLTLRLLPLVPAVMWVGTLSLGCLGDWWARGAAGLRINPDLACLTYIALIGSLPAAILWIMLRRGAVLAPRPTMFLAALAAAGLGNFALRLFHMQDAALMILIWQVGSVALLTAVACACGRHLLPPLNTRIAG